VKIERAVWLFVLTVTGLRLALLGTTDLQFDEAHYWMWSQRLAPRLFQQRPRSSFCHPRQHDDFWPRTNSVCAFSARCLAPEPAAFVLFGTRLFNASAALGAVMGLNATPIFNLGAFLMTIDPLSLFFWVAAMFSFWCVVEKSPKFSWHWPLTGGSYRSRGLCKLHQCI